MEGGPKNKLPPTSQKQHNLAPIATVDPPNVEGSNCYVTITWKCYNLNLYFNLSQLQSQIVFQFQVKF